MKNYQLRQATPEDFEFVWTLYRDTLREYVEQVAGWDEGKQRSSLQGWFKPERVELIQQGGVDVGLLVVERREKELFLESISVVPELQGRGLGAKVIGDVMVGARVATLPVSLEVLKPNPSRRLYERLGFRVTGESKTHFQMRWLP